MTSKRGHHRGRTEDIVVKTTYSDIVLNAVLPVLRGGKLPSEYKLEAMPEASGHGDHSGHTVVKRKRRVHSVVASNPDDVPATTGRQDEAESFKGWGKKRGEVKEDHRQTLKRLSRKSV